MGTFSNIAAHAHHKIYDIKWENIFVLDIDDDFFKREALLIRQKNNLYQNSGVTVSTIWSSLL